jgi:ligand-binding sensor domain-containing protein
MFARLIYLLLVLPQLCAAQYLFTNLKTEDGLSSRENYCVFVDGEGYVWIGAKNGLNRFDGSHFKLWNLSTPAYPASLGESVYTVTEHDQNQLWFGTNNGVGFFNKTNNTFSAINIKNQSGNSFSSIISLQGPLTHFLQ